MPGNLLFLAGKKALSIIRENGLKPDMINVIAGASGGPKWLVLSGLDRVIFPEWLPKKRKKHLFMIGSSIGAWRFAALMQDKPLEAIELFRHAYINQRYTSKPSPNDVTSESYRVLDAYLDGKGVKNILSHHYMRLNIIAVKSRGILSCDNKFLQGAGLASSALLNLASRKSLGFFFERALFHDRREHPPFYEMNEFPIHRIQLNEQNIRKAIMASGSIPLVMSGISGITGAPAGVYRDGGIIDYHLDIPFPNNDRDIVLYPHYCDRIKPGWFDKHLPWRNPDPNNFDNVLLICPSRNFIKELPYGKIPDRDDFINFDNDARIAYWNKAADLSGHLGDIFLDAVHTGRIKEYIRPLF